MTDLLSLFYLCDSALFRNTVPAVLQKKRATLGPGARRVASRGKGSFSRHLHAFICCLPSHKRLLTAFSALPVSVSLFLASSADIDGSAATEKVGHGWSHERNRESERLLVLSLQIR